MPASRPRDLELTSGARPAIAAGPDDRIQEETTKKPGFM